MHTRIGTSMPAAAIWAAATLAFAWNPPTDTSGPLTVAIEAPDTVKSFSDPTSIAITLSNAGPAPLEGTLVVHGVDDWKFAAGAPGASALPVTPAPPKFEQAFRLAPNAKDRIALAMSAGPSTYNAHYPIHALATFTDPSTKEKREAHAIRIFVVDAPNPASAKPSAQGPVEVRLGLTPLHNAPTRDVAVRLGDSGATRSLGATFRGSDPETRAVFQSTRIDRGPLPDSSATNAEARPSGRAEVNAAARLSRRAEPIPALSIHPPYQNGWGAIWADYDLTLPDTKPITLTFHNAIRDIAPPEPESDGVRFKVLVNGAPVFERFTKSKQWEPASVDLSQYAGRRVTLRLWSDPGPAHNTVCDSGYWGEPAISAGQPQAAAASAKTELTPLWVPSPVSLGRVFPSTRGITDARITLNAPGSKSARSKTTSLTFQGFDIEIDGLKIGDLPYTTNGAWHTNIKSAINDTWEAEFLVNGKPVPVRVKLLQGPESLQFLFSMPDVKRDERGHPRFTKISLGPAIAEGEGKAPAIQRVYAGFGNVIEKPKQFSLGSNGFQISTRHIGIDYDNGMSLLQASDVFPDRFVVDGNMGLASLQVHHDATITLIPSTKGAFEAARVYRESVAGFKPAPTLDKLKGRMCLDYWGTSYQHGIDTVEALAKYGVTDCVYVWHNWQRWGYDYRLPDIYPARGDHALFLQLAETCKRHGILFCPHDNYIDFYPDASGYSYDHIIFNEDGTPQRAWFNRGRGAQSYRWLPHAFQPWMKRNAALLMQDVKPDAYFIDVFTAIEPMDYYDRAGRFYPKTETIRRWRESFEYFRQAFNGAPMISEAGSDHHIGSLDGGESDHNAVSLDGPKEWMWNAPGADAERVPWHDMASHGSFVLFGGGLASRYVGNLDVKTHGYGSDDYLSLTVLGGRNPMAQGDSSAATVRTYWLLHDVCKALASASITGYAFDGDNIHRQTVRFSGAVVHVNRGKDNWTVEGVTLPPYGFAVSGIPACRADVSLRNGVVTAYAESADPGRGIQTIFADARPPLGDQSTSAAARPVIDFGQVATNGALRMTSDGWNTITILLLPGCPASEVRLRRPGLQPILSIKRLPDPKTEAGDVPFERAPNWTIFQTSPGDFGYRITLKRQPDVR
jgi:hypothetical protein